MSYASTVRADTPVRYYRLDEAGYKIADSSGHGNHAAASNSGITYGVASLVGNADTCMTFDGINGVIVTPPFNLPTGASPAFSLEAWVKFASPSATMVAVHLGDWTGSDGPYLAINSTGHPQAGTHTLICSGSSALSTGVPHHLVATYDGTTLTLYADGASVATTTGSIFISPIGAHIAEVIGKQFMYAGQIAQVAIYNYKLAATKVSSHFTAIGASYDATILADSPVGYWKLNDSANSSTTLVDSSTSAQNATLGANAGGAPGLLSGDSDTGFFFSGTTAASVPTTGLPTGNNPWSLEAWVKLAAYPNNNGGLNPGVVVQMGNWTSAKQAPYIGVTGSGKATGGSFNADAIGGTTLSLNTRHHLVATYDGTTLTIYVDGVSDGTTTPGTLSVSQTGAAIGGPAISFSTFAFIGDIDEVAIYATCLSSARVSSHYLAGTIITTQRTFSTRLRLAIHSTKAWTTRFRLAARSDPNLYWPGRFRLAARAQQLFSTRFNLQLAASVKAWTTRFRLAAGMTPLTLYGLSAAASTLPQAGQLTPLGGATTTTAAATLVGNGLMFGEICAQGTTQAWPGFCALPEASGFGFLWDVTALEFQQINAGTWTPTVTLSTSQGQLVADLWFRVFLYSSVGALIPITPTSGGGFLYPSATVSATPTAFTFPAASLPRITFLPGYKLYCDLWANVWTNSTASSTTTLNWTMSNENIGHACYELITPGYQALTLAQRRTLYTFGGFCLHDETNYAIVGRPVPLPESETIINELPRLAGAKFNDYQLQPRKLAVPLHVYGADRADVAMKLDALYLALSKQQQPLLLSPDGRFLTATALTAPYQFKPGALQLAAVTVTFEAPVAYSTSPVVQTSSPGATALAPQLGPLHSGASWSATFLLPGTGGTAPSLPTLTIINSGGTAITSLTIAQTTDSALLDIPSLSLPPGGSLVITCDPFAPNGETVVYGGTNTPLGWQGTLSLALETIPTAWTITATATAQPTITPIWQWQARYL